MNKAAPLKIVKASAGSGKTFNLTVHYLSLLLTKPGNYREILAVTFTNKATAEMKERILSVLYGLALGVSNSKVNAYRTIILEQFADWDEQQIQTKSKKVYQQIIHDYAHFSISTIDGFSQKVIRSFTYELNLESGYAIEMNINKVKRDLTVLLNQLLDDRPDLLAWIIQYAEQKIAKNENWNYRQQLLDLAGLIFSENFQEFDSHLVGKDTNQLFKLLDQEIAEKSNNFLQALGLAIQTFQETSQTIGIDQANLKGKSRNKVVSLSKKKFNLKKFSLTDLQKEVFDKFTDIQENPDHFLDDKKNQRTDLLHQLSPILQTIQGLKDYLPHHIAYKAVESNLYFLRLLKEMSDLLGQWRKDNSAQLISDAQILLNKLGLDEQQDPTFIWERIGNRFNYFLFDEFQDTSRIQWKNYAPLLLNALATSHGKINEHLIVGDVKQSIYRWRNGDWRILLQQVEQQIAAAFHLDQGKLPSLVANSTLQTNYRSLPNIIKFNNYLFNHIPGHLQKVLNEIVHNNLDEQGQLWWASSGNNQMLSKAYQDSTQKIPEHLLTAHSPQGSIEVEFFAVERSNTSRANQVKNISIEKICQKITEWLRSGRYKPSQIGILVRSNAQAREIIAALMSYKNQHDIQFEVISGDALTLISNQAIQLFIETLKSLVHQSENHVLLHANMAYLYRQVKELDDFAPEIWLKFKSNNLSDLAEVLPAALLEKWEDLQKMPLIHLIEKLIELYDLNQENNIHLPYLLAFKDLVAKFSSQGDRGILQFLDYWQEDGQQAVLPANGKVDAIEVITIHKSKGLAYEVVMVPFCSWKVDGMTNNDFWIDVQDSPFTDLGKIPVKYTQSLGKSIFYQQYYEEMLFNYMDALNTFYVANTRAVEHLYITAPQFKPLQDSKTNENIGFDIKNEYISDILYQVLAMDSSPYQMEDGKININQAIMPKELPLEPAENHAITLDYYPLSKELEKALELANGRSINQILMLEKASQFGILAHEIVSEVSTENQIDPLIERYIEDGLLARADKPELEEQIHHIWHHPQINSWLSGDYKVWNESSILTQQGQTLRPDKVFTSPNETIVLDFKFTQGDYIGHKSQVDQYIKALQNVGYENVKGYLYYAKSKVLVAVK